MDVRSARRNSGPNSRSAPSSVGSTSTRPRIRSRRPAAARRTSGPPALWPTSTYGPGPKWSSRSCKSSAMRRIVREAGSAGLRPSPARS